MHANENRFSMIKEDQNNYAQIKNIGKYEKKQFLIIKKNNFP